MKKENKDSENIRQNTEEKVKRVLSNLTLTNKNLKKINPNSEDKPKDSE